MKRSSTALAVIAALCFSCKANAQTKPSAAAGVQLIIGFWVDGGYDLWGRTVARHLGDHLPGAPKVLVQNMPGAGSFTAASYLYTSAPRDGSVIGLVARDAPLGPLSGASGARFDPLKLSWIGTSAKEKPQARNTVTVPRLLLY